MMMTKHLTKRRSSPYSANRRVSETVTAKVQERIFLLGTTPKEEYLKSEFLSKFVSRDTAPALVRRNRAISKWLATERENAATNDRLETLHEDYNILPRVSWSKFRDFCCSVIADIIGETVPVDSLCGIFSGGASTSRLRTESHPASKYLGKADITAAARPWFQLIFEEMPGWQQFSEMLILNDVPGNVMFTVPKTTDIDRCACKEPDINMFLQKGIGSYFRTCLRSKGINLNDQSRNRDLARQGSLDGSLATIDLSSASDSISSGLVEMLLPPLWYHCLNDIRSPITEIDGEEHVNSMFSSMGNGFTFELESLLFYSIARTVAYMTGTRGTISVYGDDIIVPSEMYHDLLFVLTVLGFSVNTKKSFAEGPFRESCGGHFYNGYDITPFYLKKEITTITDVIRIANAIRRWSFEGLSLLSDTLEDLWSYLASLVPKEFWGGSDYGSIYQLVSPDLPRSRLIPVTKKRQTGVGGYVLWLNSTWNRSCAGEIETSSASFAQERCRSRPVRFGERPNIPVFLHEV